MQSALGTMITMAVKVKRSKAVPRPKDSGMKSIRYLVRCSILSNLIVVIPFLSVYAMILGTLEKLKAHCKKMVAALLYAVDMAAVNHMLGQQNFSGLVLCHK